MLRNTGFHSALEDKKGNPVAAVIELQRADRYVENGCAKENCGAVYEGVQMNSLKRLFRRPEFPVLLFGVSLVLFIWPFLSELNTGRQRGIFAYLYGAWALVIFVLYLVSAAHGSPAGERDTKKSRGKSVC